MNKIFAILTLLFQPIQSHSNGHILSKDVENQKIAVIGAGAAGASFVHFLTKLSKRQITVFEKARSIGGRAAVIDLNLTSCSPECTSSTFLAELGATEISINNFHLVQAVEEFGLEKDDRDSDQKSPFGMWDGQDWKYYHDLSWGSWYARLQLLRKFGFFGGPLQAKSIAIKASEQFFEIYKQLDQGMTWNNLGEIIERLKFQEMSNQTCNAHLTSKGLTPG